VSDLTDALGLNAETDYARRPPVRWSQPWSSGVVRSLTALGALLVGFLLSAGVSVGRQQAAEQGARKSELIALIDARQARADALAEQLERLRGRVDAAQAAAVNPAVPALRTRLAAVEAATGLTALTGPGVQLTLSDGTGTCPAARPEDCRIQDVDLQMAANTLFALGAEGIAVNGERMIATTAIRSAGSAVLVNYRVLTSPYVVAAVGNAPALDQGVRVSALWDDFEIWRDVYGLGISLEQADEVVLPAFSGSVRVPTAADAPGSAP
jgi:uncharacterized protein YlxW (UPF0749 family)